MVLVGESSVRAARKSLDEPCALIGPGKIARALSHRFVKLGGLAASSKDISVNGQVVKRQGRNFPKRILVKKFLRKSRSFDGCFGGIIAACFSKEMTWSPPKNPRKNPPKYTSTFRKGVSLFSLPSAVSVGNQPAPHRGLSATPGPEMPPHTSRSRFLGRGCDETLFSEKRGFQ